jgi:hypothetical protein
MRRSVVIIVWIVTACFAWIVAGIGGLHGLHRFDPELFAAMMKAVPAEVLMSGIMLIGPIGVMVVVAYLGLHGKLPGTRIAFPKGFTPSGFPVLQTPRSRDAV